MLQPFQLIDCIHVVYKNIKFSGPPPVFECPFVLIVEMERGRGRLKGWIDLEGER